ncbi:hypothetical protein EV356DRAFT_502508 [Viridothelium virens]|uniref:Peptidase S54 rhomboid domain-containing protein n=1 Tax=Viridothelium virens TaxID=1048519 RepID=A0A6A6H7V8_VIRVR|nr:hypothetical protein EV356DRAFT_502508 [Viridothelium virens]
MFRSQFASFQSRRHFSGGHFDKYKSITNYRNTTRLLGGIVTVNVVGFVLWNIDRIPSDIKDRISAETRKRMPNWLKANATNSLRNFREGRWWTLLTCSFSHRDPNHLIGNMFSLYTFGTVFAYLPRGIPIVATITLGSALSASGADLAIQAARETPGYEQASLGASGVVMGLGTAAAALRRRFSRMKLHVSVRQNRKADTLKPPLGLHSLVSSPYHYFFYYQDTSLGPFCICMMKDRVLDTPPISGARLSELFSIFSVYEQNSIRFLMIDT